MPPANSHAPLVGRPDTAPPLRTTPRRASRGGTLGLSQGVVLSARRSMAFNHVMHILHSGSRLAVHDRWSGSATRACRRDCMPRSTHGGPVRPPRNVTPWHIPASCSASALCLAAMRRSPHLGPHGARRYVVRRALRRRGPVPLGLSLMRVCAWNVERLDQVGPNWGRTLAGSEFGARFDVKKSEHGI